MTYIKVNKFPYEIFLGFDFGCKRIGVAVGQKTTKTARPLKTLIANLGVPNWSHVKNLIHEWNAQALIVGMPLDLNGQEQYTSTAAIGFARELEKRFSLPVHLVDERLTTVEARSLIFSKSGYKGIKQAKIDSIAAAIILQQWLNLELE